MLAQAGVQASSMAQGMAYDHCRPPAQPRGSVLQRALGAMARLLAWGDVWVALLETHLAKPDSSLLHVSLTGHLSGIVAGIAYWYGPLLGEALMRSEFISK